MTWTLFKYFETRIHKMQVQFEMYNEDYHIIFFFAKIELFSYKSKLINAVNIWTLLFSSDSFFFLFENSPSHPRPSIGAIKNQFGNNQIRSFFFIFFPALSRIIMHPAITNDHFSIINNGRGIVIDSEESPHKSISIYFHEIVWELGNFL